MAVQPIPDGYHSLTPYLLVQDADGAMDFYKTAFGAQEVVRRGKDGKIGHAEIKIGDSVLMLTDTQPGAFGHSSNAGESAAMRLLLYVEDVDAVAARATAAGAKTLRPVKDQFYGDRTGTLRDPFGHVWTVATHKEDVPPEEMKRRVEQQHRPRSSPR